MQIITINKQAHTAQYYDTKNINKNNNLIDISKLINNYGCSSTIISVQTLIIIYLIKIITQKINFIINRLWESIGKNLF